MTALFWILATGLAAAGIGFLAWPLLKAIPPAHVDRRAAALAAHRARLAEIEAGEEGAAGDPTTNRDARIDIARSLLRDLDPDEHPAADPPEREAIRPRRGAAIVFGVAFALLAAGLYALLGEPRALAPPASPPAEEVRAAVGRLLAEAEAIGRANGNRLEGEPARLIERALGLDPDHRKALWLAAIAALHGISRDGREGSAGATEAARPSRRDGVEDVRATHGGGASAPPRSLTTTARTPESREDRWKGIPLERSPGGAVARPALPSGYRSVTGRRGTGRERTT